MHVARQVDVVPTAHGRQARWLLLAVTVCAILTTGCRHGSVARPQTTAYASPPTVGAVPGAPTRSQVEALIAEADRLDRAGSDRAVDVYYQAAVAAWNGVAVSPRTIGPATSDPWLATYHRSVEGLVDTATHYGRLDPRSGLSVVTVAGSQAVPLIYRGFDWQPISFCALHPTGGDRSRKLTHHFAAEGLGAPLIAVRAKQPNERFTLPQTPVAVTAVLRPMMDHATAADVGGGMVLEVYNSTTVASLDLYGRRVSLAYDISAPVVAIERAAPDRYFEGFIAPTEETVKPTLVMLDPYQPGKIPVVFIHGLFSDPLAWVDALNELRADLGFNRQYQVWVFRYPTGGGLLESAVVLRDSLRLARNEADPAHEDSALDSMVLVGHSLGGLLAQLQVTYSEDRLWQAIADQPLEAVQATPEMRMRLARLFYFDPVPTVRRVVFVGTPFRGSSEASRVVGRVSSQLVRFGGEEASEYRQLMEDNRDIFNPYLWRSRPTTVDMLEPDSPILRVMETLPTSAGVRTHTIIGTGAPRVLREPSDGVVSASSAQKAGVLSERYVDATHSGLLRSSETVAELARILGLHAVEARTVAVTAGR